MRRVLIPIASLSTNQTAGTDSIIHGPGCLTWHSTWETSGSASASYSLYDGPITQGAQELMYVTLSSGQSTRDFIGLHCLPFVGALHYKLQTGAVGGSFTAWVDHVCEVWLDFERQIKYMEAMQLGMQLAPELTRELGQ